jgi:hypothetical protein
MAGFRIGYLIGYLVVIASTLLIIGPYFNVNKSGFKLTDQFSSGLELTGAKSRVSTDFAQGVMFTGSAKSLMVERKNYGITPYDTVNFFSQANPCGMAMQRLKGRSKQFNAPAQRAFEKLTSPAFFGKLGRFVVAENMRTEKRAKSNTEHGYCPTDGNNTGNCAMRTQHVHNIAVAGHKDYPGSTENVSWFGDDSVFRTEAEADFTKTSSSLQPIANLVNDLSGTEMQLYTDLYTCMLFNAKPARVLKNHADFKCNYGNMDPAASTAAGSGTTTTTAAPSDDDETATNFDTVFDAGCFGGSSATVNDLKYINFLVNVAFLTHTSGRSEFSSRAPVMNALVEMGEELDRAQKSSDKDMAAFQTSVVATAQTYTAGNPMTRVQTYEAVRATDAGASITVFNKAHGKGPYLRRDVGMFGKESPKQYRDGRHFRPYASFVTFVWIYGLILIVMETGIFAYVLKDGNATDFKASDELGSTMSMIRNAMWFVFAVTVIVAIFVSVDPAEGTLGRPSPFRAAVECQANRDNDNDKVINFLVDVNFMKNGIPALVLLAISVFSVLRIFKEEKGAEDVKSVKRDQLVLLLLLIYFVLAIVVGSLAKSRYDEDDIEDNNGTSARQSLCTSQANRRSMGKTNSHGMIALGSVGTAFTLGMLIIAMCMSSKKTGVDKMWYIAYAASACTACVVSFVMTFVMKEVYRGFAGQAIYQPVEEQRFDGNYADESSAHFIVTGVVMSIISVTVVIFYVIELVKKAQDGTFASMREFI